MKFLNFFLPLRVIFALLDPNSEYGSGSKTLSLTGALFPQDEEEYNEDIPNPTPAMREVMKKRRSLAVTPMKGGQRIPDPVRSATVGCLDPDPLRSVTVGCLIPDPGSSFRFRYRSRTRSCLFEF
jgi:hypothetical protein